MEAREHAEGLVKYFERIARENSHEVWRKGLTTAREWLRLINTDNVSQAELSAFIGVVHANRYRTSGWDDLASGAYHWVRAKGVPVSPPEIFFESEGLPNNTDFYKATPLEHAHTLIALFEQYHHEDPSSEAWAIGLDTVRAWLRLIEAQEVRKSEISVLVESVFENQSKFLSKAWFHTALGVCNWCKTIGYSDLIPDNFRSLFKTKNGGAGTE